MFVVVLEACDQNKISTYMRLYLATRVSLHR